MFGGVEIMRYLCTTNFFLMIVDGINVRIKCDKCGKLHDGRFWGGSSAIAYFKQDGWSIAKNKHICNKCVELVV